MNLLFNRKDVQPALYRPMSLHLIRRQLLWIVAAYFMITAFTLYLLGGNDVMRVAGSAVGLIICGLMFAFYGDEQFDMFSPAFFWGISFAVFNGVAAIMPFLMPPEAGDFSVAYARGRPYYPLAALVSLCCMLFFFAGYRNKMFASWGKHNTWFIGRTGAERNVRLYWATLLVMGVSYFLILISGGGFDQVTTEVQSPMFYSAAGFLQSGLTVAVPLAITRALSANSEKFWKIAAIISVGVTLLFGLPSGSKTMALLAFMFIAFAWNYGRHRFSRRQALLSVVLVIIVLIVLMPFNAVYRDVLLSSKLAGQGLSENFSMMKDAAVELGERDPQKVIDLALSYTSQRLSDISIVAVLLDYQEKHDDLALGGTYFRLFYMFIPRFIWPEKPSVTFGREVAVKLDLGKSEGVVLGVEMSNTSVGLTFVGEAIYNFSIYLAPLFMFAMGAFYRWLYEAIKAHHPNTDAIVVSVACLVWYVLIFSAHESHMAAQLAGVFKFIIFLWLLQCLLKFRKNKA